MAPKRALLYARFSGIDEIGSTSSQIALCREYAEKMGYVVVAEIVEDETRQTSGADLNLPGFKKVVKFARGRNFDIFITRGTDRLARDLLVFLKHEQALMEHGIQIEYVTQNFSDDSSGVFHKTFSALFDAHEKLVITTRMTNGRYNSARRGNVLVSGTPPYGYRTIKVDGLTKLEIKEDEAEVVRLIFKLYVYGDESGQRLSLRAITKRLAENRILTPLADRKTKHAPWDWSMSVIRRMMKSDVYIGKWEFGKTSSKRDSIQVEVPAIVDRDTVMAARARLKKNKNSRGAKRFYLLRRRVICGLCGYGMHVFPANKGNNQYYVCSCRRGRRAGADTCNMPFIKSEILDSKTWDWVKSSVLEPEQLERTLENMRIEQGHNNDPLHADIKILDTQIQRNRRRLKNSLIELTDYDRGSEAYKILKDSIESLQDDIQKASQRRDELTQELKATLADEDISNYKQFAGAMRQQMGLIEQSEQSRRRLIDDLDVQVTVSVDDNANIIAEFTCKLGAGSIDLMSQPIDSLAHQVNSLTLYYTPWLE